MDDTQFLKFIYQQAQMGVVTLSKLNEFELDNDIRLTIESQILDYTNVMKQAEKKLLELGEKPAELNKLATISAQTMVGVKTMNDKSNTHIAGIVIKGSVNGIVETSQKINKAQNVDDDAKNLGYKLLLTEERNMQEMRRYL